MAQYRVVEDLSGPDYPAVVVEDVDGYRILLVEGDPRLPVRVWQRAYDAGVAMIVLNHHDAISTDDFLRHRTEHPETASYGLGPFRMVGEDPSFREYLGEEIADSQIDPLENSKFVHLHTHSEYSQLDGLGTMEEIAQTILRDPHGGGAFGSADHGNCAGHPEQQIVCDKYGLKPIFGMEAYFVPDRFRRTRQWLELDGVEVLDPESLSPAEKKRAEQKSDYLEVKGEYTHITLWAMDEVGLRNLWAMSTEAYRDGLYDGNARLDWDVLERHNEGVICGTGCLRGPVVRPLVDCACGHARNDHDGTACAKCSCLALSEPDIETARDNLLRLHRIFDDDRLFIEVHTNSLPDQIMANHILREFSSTYGIPPLAAVDAHYAIPEHRLVHQTWVAMATGKTLADEMTMFQGEQAYHLKTTEEVAESLIRQGHPDDFIHEAMTNTVEVAKRCTAKVGGAVTTPTYSKPSKEHPDPVQRDIERLVEVCLGNWERKVVGKRHSQEEYIARFEREMALLKAKGFCGYFLIVWDYVTWAKNQGCLVGPGRGSGGGSLVAYLADIVEIDPVESDLIFERFLTEGRNSLPDFDIDFPSSWRSRIIGYIKQRWGTDFVANIGTVSRLRTKQAINDVVRVLKPVLPYEVPFQDFDLLKKAVDAADAPLAGKHLPWEEFCAQYADIVEPMQQAYPDIFAVVDVVMDRLKTYGKHAAGVVISTEHPLTDLPMRLAVDSKTKEEVMVTQFDMNALEALGYVKFDFLTLRTLDTLQESIDLIADRFGVRINPYDWKAEYGDPQVWDEVSAGRTLGLFQIETASGTRLTKRMKPADLFDLAAVMTVVRPGPSRSGLTESYLRRRAGLEPITYIDDRLESFLGDTYGSMIYQEQVMATCMNLAGYDSTEADKVRKLLGKKEVEKVVAAGQEFVQRAIAYGTDPQVAETLWAQMAEFAKYGFNKAHAFAYAVLGYWCAFLRFHYPVEFLVAALSTVDADRIPDFIEDCRRSGYTIIPPDVNRSQAEFTAEGMDIIYGLNMVKHIGEASAKQIVDLAPYSSLDDFIERCVKFTGSAVNMGHLRTLVEVGAFDALVPNRRAVEIQLEREATGESKRCVFKITGPGAPVQHHPEFPAPEVCTYQWEHEPDPPMLPRGRGKAKVMVPKPPPKKCSISCRQYQPPAPVGPDDVPPYTREEIMFRERELLGTWITTSPFSTIPQEVLDDPQYFTAQAIEAAPAQAFDMDGIGLIEQVKHKNEKASGRPYAFVKINMQDGEIEAICFSSVWEQVGPQCTKDRLCAVRIRKTPKGYQLADLVSIN